MIFCFNSVLIMFHFYVKFLCYFSSYLLFSFALVCHYKSFVSLWENFFKYIIEYDSIKHFFSKLLK